MVTSSWCIFNQANGDESSDFTKNLSFIISDLCYIFVTKIDELSEMQTKKIKVNISQN